MTGRTNGDPASIARYANITARIGNIPSQGNFNFTDANRGRLKALASASRVPYQGWNPPAIPRPDKDTQEAAKEQLNNFRTLLKSTLFFDKCIGWGRDGVLTLWNYKPSRGREHRVVMKQSASATRETGARPILSVEKILHEKDVMTASTDPKGNRFHVNPR